MPLTTVIVKKLHTVPRMNAWLSWHLPASLHTLFFGLTGFRLVCSVTPTGEHIDVRYGWSTRYPL